jgi:O-antigen/teichoic acid export membrane protein
MSRRPEEQNPRIGGKTKTILLLSLTPVLSSLLMLPLIWTLGLTGLSIMRGASIAFSFTLTAYFINKIVKIQIDKKTLTKTLTASTIMAATILILQQILPDTHLLPLYILAGAATYIALIRTLKVLNGEDIQLLRQVIGKRAAEYAARILSVSGDCS